jgi:hypothetical protein
MKGDALGTIEFLGKVAAFAPASKARLPATRARFRMIPIATCT